MKKYLSLIPAILLLEGCYINNSDWFAKRVELTGEVITKEYNYDGSKLDVSKIHLSNELGNINLAKVNIHKSLEKKICVTAQESFFEKLHTSEALGTMKFYANDSEYYATKDITIDVYGYTLSEISLSNIQANIESNTLNSEFKGIFSGASDISFDDISIYQINLNLSGASTLKTNKVIADKIEMDITGASSYNASYIESDIFNLDVSGASDVIINDSKNNKEKYGISGASTASIKGVAKETNYVVSGGSTLNAKDNKTSTIKVETSGGSNAKVFASEEIEATCSGGSTLIYYGEAILKKTNTSGGAEIKKG